MKLFRVHMYLTVTLRGPDGKERKSRTDRALAVIAENEEQAQARAIGWLEHEHRDPRYLEIEFSKGKSRAIAVKVAEYDHERGVPMILVSEQEDGAMKL